MGLEEWMLLRIFSAPIPILTVVLSSTDITAALVISFDPHTAVLLEDVDHEVVAVGHVLVGYVGHFHEQQVLHLEFLWVHGVF